MSRGVSSSLDRTVPTWGFRVGMVPDRRWQFADRREQTHYFRHAERDAIVSELAAQQTGDHEGEDAVERVNAELLVGPVKGRTKPQEVRSLHAAKCALYVVLRAVGQDNLIVRPGVAICEENGLSQ